MRQIERARVGRLGTLCLAVVTGCAGQMAEPPDAQEGPPSVPVPRPGTPVPPGPAPAPGMPPADPPSAACASTGRRPGPAPLRRLTPAEYDQTVHDLLGDTTRPGQAFADGIATTPLLVEQQEQAAERLATAATKDLETFMGCAPTAASCPTQFVTSFGKRAFRRPLTPAEVTRYVGFLNAQRTQHDLPTAARQLVKAMLLSPHFLYRVEIGGVAEGGAVRLGPHEVASRLSYLFLGSMPDQALFAAADANQLDTPERVAAQARRLLASPRARDTVTRFFRHWLEIERLDDLEKDTKVYPRWKPTLAPLLGHEADELVLDLVFAKGAGFADLFGAGHSFANATLAGHYGLRGPTGDSFVEVKLDPARTAGLLTLGGLLATHAKPNQTSPIARGRFVREQLLCQPLSPPPADLEVNAPDPDPRLTTRERFAEHARNPICGACHRLIDPVGFGFEAFDGIGLWRSSENGKPIDTSGELLGTRQVDGPFNGVRELANKLAGSEEAAACFVTQWFRFAYGRAETADDECSRARLLQQLRKPGGTIRDLLVALTQTDAFLYRPATEGGSR